MEFSPLPYLKHRAITALEKIADNLERISLKLDDIEAAIDRHGSVVSTIDTNSIAHSLDGIVGSLDAIDASIYTH